MNFLLRSSQHVAGDSPSGAEAETHQPTHKRATTLEGLIADDLFRESGSSSNEDDSDRISDDAFGDASGPQLDSSSDNQVPMGIHSDVAEHEGCITIPYKELPDDWSNALDILQLHSLDRSFVFPGEQIHLLVCLAASKQETEIITPFKVAAVISNMKEKDNLGDKSDSTGYQNGTDGTYDGTSDMITEEIGETTSIASIHSELDDISATESLLRKEGHKHQTETLLETLRNSSFFVRIAESDEPLWSKKNNEESSSNPENAGGNFHSKNIESRKTPSSNLISAIIDGGGFDGNMSGGLARNIIGCYSLRNGDIVVLLQVNVAVGNIHDPILEVFQFEKYDAMDTAAENLTGLPQNSKDPCQGLLNWLFPLDRTLPPRALAPMLNSSSVVGVTQRSISASPSSQIFSFGHFRSYSMPSLPQVSGPSFPSIPPSHSKPSFDVEDYDHSSQETVMTLDLGKTELLSFRGVSLESERYSVHCGLEGIYLPRRRWHRKIEIVQPVEIHSFAADCIMEDLLCVQVKNVTPAHLPDVILYLDSIAIIFEEASKGGPPLLLPVTSVETGKGHSLQNISLRRGEEHSFILKPAITIGGSLMGQCDKKTVQSHEKKSSSKVPLKSVAIDGRTFPGADQYAVLVSCRCNYTESKLFFKQQTSWRPRIARDLMISLISEMPDQTVEPDRISPQLPVQVLTLQASNLTSEDLTLTVLAPVASNSSASVRPSNSSPTTPRSPFVVYPAGLGRTAGFHRLSSMPVETESRKEINDSRKRSISLAQRTGATSDVMSSYDLGCTHLWLQSTVPLGCVPAGSSATIKLELLPLTDGIITLSTLEVAIKEKGVTYRPEKPMKIHAASSVSTGIV